MPFKKVNPKQSFPELEEEILRFWKENEIFEKSVKQRPKDKPYRFYDGPPFITGTPHYWSLLSSICKDVVPRYQTMKWKRCERVWGWDCHGIPIEDKVQKKLGLESNKDIEKVGMEKFIEECYAYTQNTSAEWEWYIEHIGRWVDFKNSYKTMDQDYMESVMWVFKELYEKNLIYKWQRCSLYSWKLSTPISNFEIAMDDSYEEVSDPAITVKFKLESRYSAATIVKNSEWQVLLGKRKDNNLWDLPGWRSEIWENVEETARRELKEETGLEISDLKEFTKTWAIVNSIYWIWPTYIWETNKTPINNETNKFYEWKFFDLENIPEAEEMISYSRAKLEMLRWERKTFKEDFPTYLLAWTTTPWTIPAHMAIAVNENLDYVRILSDWAYYILAKNRVETVFKWKEFEIIEEFKWEKLVGLKYTPPFDYYIWKVDPEKNHIVYSADFVTDSDWTGIAHEAPEFWDVDFELAKEKGIHITSAIDNEWKYTSEIYDLEWTHYKEANDIMMERMKENGSLFKKESINHRVAMCPRTGTPLIYKVQSSWFIDIANLKEKLIAENEWINWSPEHLKYGQFLKSMEAAPDWCISRTRYWWAPMPVWTSKTWKIKVFGSRDEIFQANKKYGQLVKKEDWKYYFTDNWKELDLHRPYIDKVLVKDENNFKAKNVLGVHGYDRTMKVVDFLAWVKESLEQNWVKIDTPNFERWEKIDYKNWEKVFDSLDMSSYDTIVAHSLGCRASIEYIIEKRLKLKRLVLVAPGIDSVTKEVNDYYISLKHDIAEVKNFVEEIIVIASKDDTIQRNIWAKIVADSIRWNLVEVNWYGHFNIPKCELINWIVKFWNPMQRIPEVLDCWVESGSMPYAQDHYPFENKGKMEASYPADFIVEYIGQVRAWFYVMHVLWVALFGKRSYTNVITTWIVNGNDWRKMSKSYGNYPDPKETILKYWADSIRFYMINSPLLSGGNLSFNEEQVHEVVKKVLLPLWNTYYFFTTYANIDNFSPKKWNIYFVRHGETDNNVWKNNHWKTKMNPGDVNSDLNTNGKNQAIEAGRKLKNEWINIDIIITSPLTRAVDTAKIIAKEINYNWKIIQDERLKEMLGWVLKDYSHDEIRQKFWVESDYEVRKVFKDKKNNKAESIEELDNRIIEAYEEIRKNYKDKNVLIVSHTSASRSINKLINNLSDDEAHYSLPSFPNAKIFKFPEARTNKLDKWIISELNKLIKEVWNGLDNYRLQDATRPITKFLDNLTNWYIRRSRKRFWKSENDGDKLEAYETLYEVLITVSKIIAPFTPFISEYIFKNLTWKESVHLEYFPDYNPAWIMDTLNAEMDKTQKIITLGLAWRANQKIRVRQPLKSITITEILDDYNIEIIKEELNVKEVLVVDWNSLAKQICKPNGRAIWPKFGWDVKFIMWEAKSGNFEILENWNAKVWNFILEAGDFELVFEAGESWTLIETGFWMVIAMDNNITEELKLEWYARDIVRYIQESRKEADYQVDDRIQIKIKWANEVINWFNKYIENETLSNIVESIENADLEKEVEIEELKVKLSLKR